MPDIFRGNAEEGIKRFKVATPTSTDPQHGCVPVLKEADPVNRRENKSIYRLSASSRLCLRQSP